MTELKKLKKLTGKGEQYRWIVARAKPYFGRIMIIVLMTVAASVMSVLTAQIYRVVVDAANLGSVGASLLIPFAIYALMIILDMGLNIIGQLVSVVISEKFGFGIRQDIFRTVLYSRWLEISRYHSGDLLTRLTSDINQVTSGIMSVMPSLASFIITFSTAMVFLLIENAWLALSILIIAPVAALTARMVSGRLQKVQKKVQESEAAYRSFIQENMSNLPVVKSFCWQDESCKRLAELHKQRLYWLVRRNRLSVLAGAVLSMAYWIGYLLAFVWGAVLLSQGSITVGTMIMYAQLVSRVQSPIIGLAQTMPKIISILASAERLMEIEPVPPEREGKALPPSDSLTLDLADVGFSYREGEPVLEKVDMHLKPGDIAALTGLSGVGKTTLIRLLLMLIEPDHGAMTVSAGGSEVHELSSALRTHVGYVPQGNSLFSGTIADNLRMGKPDATDEEMRGALESADAWRFVDALPKKMDTAVGERGVGLSEGQAQRVAIARALIRRAPLLILDEATSALDEQTECRVLSGVHDFNPQCTCLTITHRKSVLAYCNRRFEMENGVLREIPLSGEECI